MADLRKWPPRTTPDQWRSHSGYSRRFRMSDDHLEPTAGEKFAWNSHFRVPEIARSKPSAYGTCCYITEC